MRGLWPPSCAIPLLVLLWSPVHAQNPDLIVDRPLMEAEWTAGWQYIPPGDCAIEEGCVLAPGVRKVVAFSIQTANISQTELSLGDPTSSPYFGFSTQPGSSP